MLPSGLSDAAQRKGSTPKSAAYRIFWIYVAIGLAWIFISDTTVYSLTKDPDLDVRIDLIKGCCFVLATGFLIKWLLQRELEARERTVEDLRFFRQLKEVANDPSFVLDPTEDFKLVYVNAAAERHFKLPKDKLLTMRVYEWSPDATPALAQNALKQCREHGFFFFESRHRLTDGSIIPVEVSLNLMVYHGREYIGGYFHDISERRRTEQALREQRTMLEYILNSVPQGVFWKDKDSRYLGCNRVFAQAAGLKEPADIIGKTDFELPWGPREANGYVADDRSVMASRQAKLNIIEPITLADGSQRWVETSKTPLLSPDGNVFAVLGTFIDITEARRSHERLLLQESALNAAANGILITDRKGSILWTNPAFTTLTGYQPEEVVGLTPQILKSGRQTPEFYHDLWQTIQKGEVWRGELINKRKDGSIYDEDMTITPVRDAAGHVTHFIAIKQDVTQRKQLEAQYLRAQRMEGIGMLAGGIAHDLNNVLAPIIMSIQILKEIHPDDETAEILVGLQESAQRGADIVRQVLTFARGIKGERLLLAPKHLIKDMVRVAKEAFPRNIAVHSDVATDLWNVMGDPTQLHQVLLNLSVNARDAMPDGGILSIKASNVTMPEGESILGVKMAAGDYTVISVKDSGTGIPLPIQERIFEPFFTTKDQGKGTGLGLSTVMGIVKSHHGYIKLLSEPGKGSDFQIYLPAIKTGLHEPVPDEETNLPQGHGELVLLVDDEEMIRMVGRDILTRHGYRVLLASDGTEAMAAVAQQIGKIHLVITDIMMPYMDGVALVRGLRKMAPEIKVLACSGLASGASMTNKVDELKRLGVHPILHKPFTARKLLVNVHHILHNEPLEADGI